jgi:hypothetical protein
MKIRRKISIDKGDLDTLKPFLDSNGGNLSLALRQMIGGYRESNAMMKMKLIGQLLAILETTMSCLTRYKIVTSTGKMPSKS